MHGQQVSAMLGHTRALLTTGGGVQAGQGGGGAIETRQRLRVLVEQGVTASQVEERFSRPPAII